MQLIDVKFDNGQGEATVDLSAGVVKLTVTETNPNAPGNVQLSIPLDPLLEKLAAQAPNAFVKYSETVAQKLLDAIP